MQKIVLGAPACALFALCAGASPAAAQVSATLSADVLQDSNIFRTSRDLSDTLGIKRDDTLATVHGEVNAVVKPGLTTITVNARAGHDWYSRNDDLSNFNYAVNLAMEKPDEGVFGYQLHAQAEQRLTPFGDLGLPVRNLQSVQHIFGQATLAITPSLRIVATPDVVRSTNDSASFRGNDFRQYGSGIGLGYFSPLGNSISLTVTKAWTKGLNDRLVPVGEGATVNSPIDLDDTSVDLRLEYSPSVLTKITGRLSYVDRTNKSVNGGNYSGPAGSLEFIYRPRDSLELTASAGRRLESQSYIYIESIRNDYASLAARLGIATGTRVGLTADYYNRRFSNDTALSGASMSLKDSTYRLGASLEQRVFQRLSLRVVGQHERRNADNELFSYTSNSVLLGAALSFGAER